MRTIYGSRDTTQPPASRDRGPRHASDPRYNQRRWKALAIRVRRRDGRCMIVAGCARGAQMADHIVPVFPGMPDSLFFAESNLRGGCFYHNTLRGQADKAARELGEGGRSLGEAPVRQRPLSNLSPLRRTSVLTGDYTRPQGDRG